MSFSDYLLDIALVLIVVRQMRESRFGLHVLVLPIGIMSWVALHYLKALPTGGNDLLLIGGLTAIGALCGVVGAYGTRVRTDVQGRAFVRAGWASAGVWVASMGLRLAFAIWASHGGGPHLVRFDVAHHLTVAAWTDALVLMALGEVVVRMGLLLLRTRRALAGTPTTAPAAAPITV